MSADDTVFSALEDVVSALVAEKHGPGCVLGGFHRRRGEHRPGGRQGQERVAVRRPGITSGASRTRRVRARHVRALSEEALR